MARQITQDIANDSCDNFVFSCHLWRRYFLTWTISKLVKPDIQTIADGVRLILCMFGSIVATDSITFVEKHANLLLMGLLILLILSLVLVVKRRKTLMKPQAIV